MLLQNRMQKRGLNAHRAKFARPLMDMAACLGFSEAEESKEQAHPTIGVSRRQFQIDLSEKFMKQVYGPGIFGRILLHRLKEMATNSEMHWVLVSDSGFREEADVLLNYFGRNQVVRCHLERSGTSYTHDSRSNWTSPLDLHTFVVRNDSSPYDLVECILAGIRNWEMP